MKAYKRIKTKQQQQQQRIKTNYVVIYTAGVWKFLYDNETISRYNK